MAAQRRRFPLGEAAVDVHFSQSFSLSGSIDTRPVFLTSNGVQGVVEIDYNALPPASHGADLVRISLYGVIQMKIPNNSVLTQVNGLCYTNFEQKILNVVDVLSLPSASLTTGNTKRTSIKFDVALPNASPQTAEESDDLWTTSNPNTIPSSVSVGSMLHSSSAGCGQSLNVKVDYTLQIHVIRNGQVIGSTSRGLRIFDSGGPQPPLCLSDFSSEYLCRQKRTLRRHLFTRMANLSAAISEPRPFMFCIGKELATTRLPISFMLEDLKAELKDNGELVDPLDVSLIWRLKTSTFASIDQMTSAPTRKEVNRREATRAFPMAMVSTLGRRHEMKLTLSDWQQSKINTTDDKTTTQRNVWTTFEALSISIPTAASLAPTFFNPHVSRRYSLMVQIKMSGCGKVTLRLEVPVQIAYENNLCALTNVPRYQDVCGSQRMHDSRSGPGEVGFGPVARLPVYVP